MAIWVPTGYGLNLLGLTRQTGQVCSFNSNSLAFWAFIILRHDERSHFQLTKASFRSKSEGPNGFMSKQDPKQLSATGFRTLWCSSSAETSSVSTSAGGKKQPFGYHRLRGYRLAPKKHQEMREFWTCFNLFSFILCNYILLFWFALTCYNLFWTWLARLLRHGWYRDTL